MSDHSWFCDTPGGSGRLRLFCFPFAGGNAALFRPWQAILGPEIALSAVQLPGRGARVFEPPYVDLDLLVAALQQQIRPWLDRPFAFFGHSLGALVAFELTRALRRAGLPMPCALWVSGAEGPQTREIRHRLHDLKPADFTAALRDYGGTPQEVLDEEELMALLSPGLRADFALSERYVYRPQPPLDVPLHLLRGEDDPYVDARRAAGWSLESR